MSEEKNKNEPWSVAMADARLREMEQEDVIAHRAWMKSDAYWLRVFTSSGIGAGIDPAKAAYDVAGALGIIRDAEGTEP